jgi:Zn-dependent peptidase ImmA (M78 family)
MYRKRKQFIEELATRILQETDSYHPCADVKAIAQKRGIRLKLHDFGDDVTISGVLVIKDDQVTIGYNQRDHKVRQRFTIAHELGHYELKHKRDGLFIDDHQKQFSLFLRDANSSTGEILQEREANAFAAALLMPAALVKEELQKYHFDLSTSEDGHLIALAKQFGVSMQAMTFRIANLRLM